MISHTPTEREIYEANLKAARDERSRLSTAMNKGVTQGRAIGRAEGRIEGRVEGRIQEAREAIIEFGQVLLGPLTEWQRRRIDETEDLAELHEFRAHLQSVRSWDAVIGIAPK